MSDELLPDSGLRTLTVAPDAMVIAIDGETQTTAWHDIYRDPEAFGLTYSDLSRRVRIPFELYLGLSPADARQIFYDRNVKGIDVAKNLAMSMDQRDLATRLAHTVGETLEVESNGQRLPFGRLVNAGKRQLTKADKEVVTLSALRALIVTTIFGSRGVQYSAASVDEGELPLNTDADEVERVVVRLVSRLIGGHFAHFARRDAITAPAVMAALGILLHRTTPWCDPGRTMSFETAEHLLAQVRWERDPAYWDGVCASVGSTGRLNFSGGVRDSAGRVAGALLDPHSELGRKVRGLRG
ncbi:DNA sulfur modification protein DndB [Streptomyces coelicoflavus]|uniref:DNA sulfur modification protein DndB n=1 Tax=Streptomyces coelicoflavus TaxID=285562 RepID=UPI003317E800